MNTINQIYRVSYMKDKFSYVGLLRNEKKFNINDKVFFSINGNEIAFGRIVGVELLPADNPEYQYKIELPEELIRQRMKFKKFYEGREIDKITLNCESIFSTVQEAKESALKNLERMEKLQRQEIERYFGQF
jgi:4-hydroxyphenylpyruvate dioxygenase-like putative hemolysin